VKSYRRSVRADELNKQTWALPVPSGQAADGRSVATAPLLSRPVRLTKAMTRRHDIFICHASADKQFVRQLAKRLRAYGVKVWLDEWELNVGDSLHTRIEAGIQNSSYMLVVVSRGSLERPWVQRELTVGLTHELKRRHVYVIPVLVDVDPTDLPPMLADKLAADFRRDPERGLKAILRRVGISDRVARRMHPSHEDVELAWRRLPQDQRWNLMWGCWRRRMLLPNGKVGFSTDFLGLDERRCLIG